MISKESVATYKPSRSEYSLCMNEYSGVYYPQKYMYKRDSIKKKTLLDSKEMVFWTENPKYVCMLHVIKFFKEFIEK